METHNGMIFIAIVMGFLVMFSFVKLVSPTGGAVAAQEITESEEWLMVDDITCKEWNLCFINWTSAESSTVVAGEFGYVPLVQNHRIAMANGTCVKQILEKLMGRELDLEFTPVVPIPANCLVQKDPVTTEVELPEDFQEAPV